MGEVDQWVEVGVIGKQIVGVDVGYLFEDFVFEFCFLFCWDKYLGVVGVYLIGVVEVGYYGNIGGEVEVGIIGDNQW